MQAVFGYPNEEAYWKDFREFEGNDPGLGMGFYEIVGSKWGSNINEYNLKTYGNEIFLTSELRHFFIGGKDESCQFYAHNLRIEIFDHNDFGLVTREALKRSISYPER